MKLNSYQIKNYRSIIDSGIVDLSLHENVTILAGQNEAGKSAILKALFDFENKVFDITSLPFSVQEGLVQSVSCTYFVEDSKLFFAKIVDYLISNFSLVLNENEKILNKKEIDKIETFTITRENISGTIHSLIDEKTFNIFRASILKKTPPKNENQIETEKEKTEEELKIINIDDDDNEKVANVFALTTPRIQYFDDFCDLLPNKILVSALENNASNTQGYRAVRNLEKILDTDFVLKNKQLDSVRRTVEDIENSKLSIDFQEAWGQKIHGENKILIKYNFEKRNGTGETGSYINFFVETKNGQPLPPQQRSKGLIWFLSLWLELQAQDIKNNDLILLLDEPDQHLHVRAQKDILAVINKLSKDKKGKKGKQIICATHSQYLIEAEYLNRVRLVINAEQDGTIIENITTSKIDTQNKKDALQPIANALGLSVSEFSPLQNRNVILEGISDFYYFSSMKLLLGKEKEDYSFIPGIGVRQIKNLISFSIGYGLDWIAIVDDDPETSGKDTKKNFDEIKNNIFDGDETKTRERVYILNGIVGIENMFTHADFLLVDPTIKEKKDMVNEVGKNRKVLFSKLFFEKVKNGEISKEDISSETIDRFSAVFAFITDYFS